MATIKLRQNGPYLVEGDDVQLLDWAREVAPWMLDRHPALADQHIDRWLGSKAAYLRA